MTFTDTYHIIRYREDSCGAVKNNRKLGKKAALLVPLGIIGIAVGCMVTMPGKSHRGALPAATDDDKTLAEYLRGHVEMLATEIGERNIRQRYFELNQAAEYIEKSFRDLGYEMASQQFEADGKIVRNLEAVKTGKDRAKEIIVVGAHYDSAIDTPGANDNASGVAAMIELARLLKSENFSRTVRFVAFVNEEPPYFHTEDMGSLRYAKQCQERGDNIVAMLSLETIGYYSDQPGSQKYPPLVSALYPDQGNFIAFIGNLGSGSLVRRCGKIFRETTSFPSEGAILPGTITGVDWSDHWSFWEAGYDGVMITDTAIFRYPHYHESTDTPDKIDYERTARVITGLHNVLKSLATEER